MRWKLLLLSWLATARSDDSITVISGNSTYRNIAYFGNWATQKGFTPQQLPIDSLTHIIYAFADIHPETGEVFLSDPLADTGSLSATSSNLNGNFQQLYLLKKQNRSLKVLLSIGGQKYSPHFVSPASNRQGRLTFASSLLSLIKDLALDGVDIDWEYPANNVQATDMVLLVQAVSNTLAPYNYTVSVACPGPFGYTYLLPAEMDQYVDFWNLMAYDYTGPWSNVAGNQANLFHSSDHPESTPFDTESVINYYTLQGISPTKIVLGIPLYGRYFNSTDGLGQSSSGDGTYSVKNLPFRGAAVVYDNTTGSSYSYDNVRKQLVSYDNIDVAKQKAAFIQDRLGGAMYWESSEDGIGSESIIQTVARILEGNDSLGLDRTPNQLLYLNSTYNNVRHGMLDSSSAPLSSTLSPETSSTTGTISSFTPLSSTLPLEMSSATGGILSSSKSCTWALMPTTALTISTRLSSTHKTQPETSTTLSRITDPVTEVDLVVVACTPYSGSQTCKPVQTTIYLENSSK